MHKLYVILLSMASPPTVTSAELRGVLTDIIARRLATQAEIAEIVKVNQSTVCRAMKTGLSDRSKLIDPLMCACRTILERPEQSKKLKHEINKFYANGTEAELIAVIAHGAALKTALRENDGS